MLLEMWINLGWCSSVDWALACEQRVPGLIPSHHAWVAGQLPSEGRSRGNHTLMFLSLSFSFLSPLSKNKINKILKKKKCELKYFFVNRNKEILGVTSPTVASGELIVSKMLCPLLDIVWTKRNILQLWNVLEIMLQVKHVTNWPCLVWRRELWGEHSALLKDLL